MLYLNQKHVDILTRSAPLPETLNVELTTMCNMRCIMCMGRGNHSDFHTKQRHLSVDEFKRILAGLDLGRLRFLNFTGNTESLMNPHVSEILRICKGLGIGFDLTTNGMLLTKEVAEMMVGAAREIHVSFGGATKEVFESIRVGADFNRICGNIHYLNELSRAHGTENPRVWINPIMMKRNIHSLPQMVRLAHQLGCHGIALSHLIVNSHELAPESLYFHQEESNHYLAAAAREATSLGIQFSGPELFGSSKVTEVDQGAVDPPWKKCTSLWETAILGLETTQPCCGGLAVEGMDSNAAQTRFRDIWQSDWYAEMRYRLLTGNPPEACLKCRDTRTKDVDSPTSYFVDGYYPESIESGDPTREQVPSCRL